MGNADSRSVSEGAVGDMAKSDRRSKSHLKSKTSPENILNASAVSALNYEISGEVLRKKKGHHGQTRSLNTHEVQPDIKIHSVASEYLDPDHEQAMSIPLGEVTDEQLLAEVARRHLDIHASVSENLVRETYVFEKNIGHGASGEVFLVSNRFSNEKFACKVVRKDSTINDAKSMSTEIEIMKKIRHRHIVSMFELYESPKCLWIILEYVNGGDLRDYLLNVKVYTEVIAARFMKQMLMAIHYLHTIGVVHRDLKLDNILKQGTGDNCDLKIADFGLSALVRIGEGGYDAEESSKRKSYCELREMWGTKEFFAPELIDQAYGPQADMWSIGCIMYEMLAGRVAFPYREHSSELYERIQAGAYDMNVSSLRKVSADAKDLLRSMLLVDPTKRVSASEALRHRWITGTCYTDEHNQILEETMAMYRHTHQRRR